ncbi:MAG: hypothetical protein JRE28_04800 [Deltaproteobacteria bacterium]|nr:hypothetical protein [Deltaproteobacteria bacterium]
MKDELGFYYYPFPQNKQVHMYVLRKGDDICFRLWNADDAKLWEEHGWVPYGAIQKASNIYNGKSGFVPNQAYDLNIAKALLEKTDRT